MEQGRPEDVSNRIEKERKVYDWLERLGILYYRVDHEELHTMEACQEVNEMFDNAVCKNLFLCNSQKTVFYLLMMPGNKKFRTKELSQQINTARLSFAGPEHLQALLGLTPGSVTVLGLMNDTEHQVNLLIDQDLLEQEYIAGHPCINTSTLKIRMEDLIHAFLPSTGHQYRTVCLSGEED